MSAYTPPDKIEIYAAALQSDINSERFQQVVDSKLKTYWIGTVYGGGVATRPELFAGSCATSAMRCLGIPGIRQKRSGRRPYTWRR